MGLPCSFALFLCFSWRLSTFSFYEAFRRDYDNLRDLYIYSFHILSVVQRYSRMKDEDRHKISLIHISLLYRVSLTVSTCKINGTQAMSMNDCVRREYAERGHANEKVAGIHIQRKIKIKKKRNIKLKSRAAHG